MRRIESTVLRTSLLRTLCRRGNTLLVAGFVTTLIVWSAGYALPALAMAVLSGLGLGVMRHPRGVLDREDGALLIALVGYAGVWLWDVWRTSQWPESRGDIGMGLPWWPLLAAWLLVWLRHVPPSRWGWWSGLIGGGVAVGAIALYERAWLGLARASNGMNAIPFGDISLLLGALSLIALIERGQSRERYAAWWACGLALAALGGFSASLLSGTRGGWIALPVLAWLIYRDALRTLSRRARRGIMLACLGLVTGRGIVSAGGRGFAHRAGARQCHALRRRGCR